ncbi:FadR/GntR family transcriptional regulator [Lachnospiraceae bacterium 62-35]
MELINIAKKNLVDEAHSQIKQMIINGVWKEGELLPSEHNLCQNLGVSRVVVREVLQRLRAEKLVLTRQGVGSFVSNPNNFEISEGREEKNINLTEKEFLEIMEFRKIIEYPALRLAIERGTPEDFAVVAQALDGMKASVGKVEEFSVSDYHFHFAITKASHNEMLCKAMESCQKELYCCFCQMNGVNDVLSYGVEMHRAIYEAMIQRDTKRAIWELKNSTEYNHARLSELFAEKEGPEHL